MVADLIAKDESGQSVLEFLMMLPVMVGLVVLMVRINTAIQVSIVNQQYARAQATWLTFNSPVFPEIKLRYAQLAGKEYNQMLLGVADNVTPGDGSPYVPQATVQNVSRFPKAKAQGIANNDPQTEPDPSQGGLRALVRVRDTVSLCAQPTVMNVQGKFVPILNMTNLGDKQSPAGVSFNLTEGQTPKDFDYCRSGGVIRE